MIDILFINPSNSKEIYQNLSNKYSAIEPPTWSLLLAQSCRVKGYKVAILDCLAENIDDKTSLQKIKSINPRILCFVVYGQNVNAGTTNMSGATRLSKFLKKNNINKPICYIGSHVQALPVQTLKKEKSIDFVFINEGVYALWELLKLKNFSIKNLKKINGIVFRDSSKIIFNKPNKLVPNDRMDLDLPGYAWDLLPFKNKPLDLYRSPLWHAEYLEANRSPYAAIQTSLGCQFKCSFCMINVINRDDTREIAVASKYSGMRYWSPEFIIKEFDKLFNLGVKTIKITDEMFLLNPKYYLKLCELLKDRNKDDKIKMWAYSRVDTVKNIENLKTIRQAGIKWLCLGIESGEKRVRFEVSKGKFEEVDIKKIVNLIEKSDIQVMGNYIFGLPGDDLRSMKKTFSLSKKLCTLGWNGYAAMALPGSELYYNSFKKKNKLPKKYEDYSFHSYNTLPLDTEKLSSKDILKFRDKAFLDYHTNSKFLKKIKNKFGKKAKETILEMTKIKLKRKILEK